MELSILVRFLFQDQCRVLCGTLSPRLRGGDQSSSHSTGRRAHVQTQVSLCCSLSQAASGRGWAEPWEGFLKSVVFVPQAEREMVLPSPSSQRISRDLSLHSKNTDVNHSAQYTLGAERGPLRSSRLMSSLDS